MNNDIEAIPKQGRKISLKVYAFTKGSLVTIPLTTMYFKGLVTLFFANNYLTEYRITMEFNTIFFRP